MLCNATDFNKIVLITGYSDCRKGVDSLALMIRYKFNMDPFEKLTLYMFCGRSVKKLRAIYWDGTGFWLLSKRLEEGRFVWPRDTNEAMNITQEQFEMLMNGFSVRPAFSEIKKELII